jgi:phage gpG-like protein
MRVTIKIKDSSISTIINNISKTEKKLKEQIKEGLIEFSVEKLVKGSSGQLTSDGHVLTGRLRQSIHAKYNKKYAKDNYLKHRYMADISGERFAGSLSPKISDLEVVIGTDVPYARMIEFRHNSYLQRTFETNRDSLIGFLKRKIQL